MRLFVPTMDAFLVEFDERGRIRFDNEDWSTPVGAGAAGDYSRSERSIGRPEGIAGRAGE